MTSIMLFVERPRPTVKWYEDHRGARHLMMLINTGRLRFGDDLPEPDLRGQSSLKVNHEVICISYTPPVYQLSLRMWVVLYMLADELPLWLIAGVLGISIGWLLRLCEEIRCRTGEPSLTDAVKKAVSLGAA